VTQSHSVDILADFAHQLRQPLSVLDALVFYLDLITTPEDTKVQEHLRRMHCEIAHTDQILRDGLRTVRAHFSTHGPCISDEVPPVAGRSGP
jgi:signal transduction histidine kinase